MSSPHSVDLPPGTDVGGWVVERVIGHGGMGTVYAATHSVIGRRAALKVIHRSAAEVEHGIERFIREARLVNQIRHPAIVDIVGFDRLPDGRPVLVMELLEGETVAQVIARSWRIDQKEAIDLILPVLSALSATHAAGVVHRDLKPENLFVTATADGSRTVKVLDFGIAKLGPALDAPSSRATGVLLGTPMYMSPEQCVGGTLDARSDLYNVGLIMYEMLAGVTPFGCDAPSQYLIAHVEQAPRPIETFVKVDPRLAALLVRLLAKDPASRPSSASELARELRALRPSRGREGARQQGLDATVSLDGVEPKYPSSEPIPETRSSQVPMAPITGDAVMPAAMEENRLCTILFADISGFSALSEKLAPELVKEIVDGCFASMTAVVQKHGGTVDKYIGDCVMAVFGVPRVRDDDAERAVLAALELQRAVEKFSSRNRRLAAARTKLTLRIGLNTGVVFVGGVGARRDVTVTGDAVNVASRLQTAAPTSSVVLGAATWRQVVGLFRVESLEPLLAKGKSEPLEWYRVEGRETDAHVFAEEELYGIKTQFIGRAGELDKALDAMDEAIRLRRPCCLTVVGATGVGKTRLRNEVFTRASARPDGALVLTARGSGLDDGGSYDLAATLLRRRFHVQADDPREVVEQKIRNGVRAFGRLGPAPSRSDDDDDDDAFVPSSISPSVLGDDIDVLATMLGTQAERRVTMAGERVDALGPRIRAALARLIGIACSRAPVVILCDALERADDASLDLLDDLVARLDDAPLFILGTTRPDLYERRPHWGEGSDAHARLALEPLSGRATRDLAADLLQRVRPLPDSFVARLIERAEGNPLVLRETLRGWIDSGAVVRDNDAFRVVDEWEGKTSLPPTLYGIVQTRLDRLPRELRDVLHTAAVVGRVFWDAAVQAMDDAPSEVPARLEQLRQLDLVRVRERSSFHGAREYAFAMGVTQEVAYATLSARSAQRHHLALARWLEARGQSFVEGNPALVAQHFDRGGAVPEAIRLHGLGARRTATLGRNEDAVRSFARACALADAANGAGLPEGSKGSFRDVDECRVAPWTERVELRLGLGDALRRLGKVEEARAAYERARTDVLRDEHRSGERLDVAAVARFEGAVELRLGLLARIRGAFEGALAHFVEARARLGEDGDPRLIAPLASFIAMEQFRTGRQHEAMQTARRGLEACRRIPFGDPDRSDAACRLLGTMGTIAYHMGRLVQAERLYLQSARVVDEARFPELAARAWNNIAAVYFKKGEVPRARVLFAHSLALKERIGDRTELAFAYNNLAEVDRVLGNKRGALQHIERAVHIAEALRAQGMLSEVYRNQAETLLLVGDLAGAVRAAQRSFDAALLPGEHDFLEAAAKVFVTCCTRASGARERLDASTRASLAAIVEHAREHVPRALAIAGLTEVAAESERALGEVLA